ncbi:hypothetical protein [uncultured Endozoicomonas sp.]|uniref:hypothetical protein n=1 Tax=uncultured Endozoicomonas sp. TaxID=432652 RepID=UPI00262A1791|nr:hypothetical protein [uncultured Endozoicomonas sp.]
MKLYYFRLATLLLFVGTTTFYSSWSIAVPDNEVKCYSKAINYFEYTTQLEKILNQKNLSMTRLSSESENLYSLAKSFSNCMLSYDDRSKEIEEYDALLQQSGEALRVSISFQVILERLESRDKDFYTELKAEDFVVISFMEELSEYRLKWKNKGHPVRRDKSTED